MRTVHTNLNNKRLSRLQRLILTVLHEQSSGDYASRNMIAWQVARRYGNGSIVTIHQREEAFCQRQAENYERNKQEDPEIARQLLDLAIKIGTAIISRYRQSEWLTPKFSVSWEP